MPADFELIDSICTTDCEELAEAEKSYGDSWKLRGGVGAFMMLARKWDRIENQCKEHGYDVFKAVEALGGVAWKSDGVIDDIRDLRRYLLLVEQHMVNEMGVRPEPTFPSVPDHPVCAAEPTPHGYVNQDGPDHVNAIKQGISKPVRP